MAFGACLLLIAKSSNSLAFISSLTYSFGLLLLFGVSAFYHRLHWEPKGRALMKRLDHSAIFIVIAGTFTPICLLALSETEGRRLLLLVWCVAVVGILQSIFWVKAPKWFTALFYISMGWTISPYLLDLQVSIGSEQLGWLAAGGIAYTLGAVFYALKRPRLAPPIFGYHELFHLLTIIGAAFHFIVVYKLIS